MSEKITSLWPAEFPRLKSIPPVVILRQQAYLLGESTKNIVEGAVASESHGVYITHSLYLRVPALNSRFELLQLRHQIETLYPVFLLIRNLEKRFSLINELDAQQAETSYMVSSFHRNDRGVGDGFSDSAQIFNEIGLEKVLRITFGSEYATSIVASLITQSLDPAA